AFAPPLSDAALRRVLTLSPVPGVPADPTNRFADDASAAEFGRHLFHSRALSKDGDVSCATCHDPRDSFVDGERLAKGVLPLERHTMGLWNVAHQRWFLWDGRADSLWAQALIPLEDPLEHATTRTDVARAVYRDPELRRMYEETFGPMPPLDDEERFPPASRPVPPNDRAHQLAAEHAAEAAAEYAEASAAGEELPHHTHRYGSGFYHPHQRAWDGMAEADREAVTDVFVDVGKALAAFQRRFRSADSAFDRFVAALRARDAGEVDALSPSALRGLELFVGEAQCVVCHHGPLLTDYEFHDTRVPAVAGAPVDDPGRSRGLEALRASEFGVTSRWSDDPDGPARVKVDYLPSRAHGHAGGDSGEFKTPSLRNVALTPPYMHNGAFETLDEVVSFYVTREGARPGGRSAERILRPLSLDEQDRRDLVAFLESLTDDSLDLDLVRAPAPR
ncbi:MAG: cytochrome c peroxidase, partial [Planctomycetota bacterium]